jgi:two-component system, cell cycle response regulator DivK
LARVSRQAAGAEGGFVSRILLVEDNEMNRDMLSRRLERRGYQVVMAVDGQQGVDMTRAESPDLILLDMSLPVIDGWEVARQLKSDEATAQIPIIALTAHAMSGDREKALEAGCNDYDTKPVDLARLIEKMESLLGKKGAAQ